MQNKPSEPILLTMMNLSLKMHMILWSIMILIVVMITWAHFAELEEVTKGNGKIIPSSELQIVQNLEGGIIKNLYVSRGETVLPGQLLMQLDDISYKTQLEELNHKIRALKLNALRTGSEATGQDFNVPKDIIDNDPHLYAAEMRLFKSRKHEIQVQKKQHVEDIFQRQQELNEHSQKLTFLEQNYKLLKKEYDLLKPLTLNGAAAEMDLIKLQRQLIDLESEISQHNLSIPRLKSQIDLAQQKLAGLEAQFQREAFESFNKSKLELNQLFEESISINDKVKRTAIRSPVKGIVNDIKHTTIGGVVQSGEEIMTVVPIEDTLVIEAQIRPEDRGFIDIGHQATIKITAYDFSIYGGLPGTVEFISSDTIANERNELFFQVHIRTQKNHLTHNNTKLFLKPGMSAEINILTGHKSMLQYILKPIIKTKENAFTES